MTKYEQEIAVAYTAVTESRFEIPEDVPAHERTAFHGAAAAAHKAGKSHFNFGGKKHPVTMKKDVARAIADETICPKCKGEGCDHCDGKGTHEAYKACSRTRKEGIEDIAKPEVRLLKKKKKSGEDDPEGSDGEAVMNPKQENVKTADRKPETYTDDKGKKRVRMVPVDKNIVHKESTMMSFRDKLISVLERKDEHTKGATAPEEMMSKQKHKAATDMVKDTKADSPDVVDIEKQSHDDASKAGRITKPSAKNTTDKNAKGDKNIINPVKDTTKSGKGDPVMKESVLKERKDTAHHIAKTLRKMGVRHDAKEHEILPKIPHALKKHGLHNDKLIKRDRDFQGDVIDSLRGMKESVMKESFSQVVRSIANAYQSMYEKSEEVMEDAEKHKKMAADHKEKMLDAKEEDHRDGMTAHRMAHDAHMAAAKEYDKAPDSHTATKAKIAGQKAMDHSKKANSVFN